MCFVNCYMFSKIHHYLRFEFSQRWIWQLCFPVVLMSGHPEEINNMFLLNAHICVPKYTALHPTIPWSSYNCLFFFRRLHRDSPVWRMTWSSQEQARVAIQMMKMSVLHFMKVGQVIIFSNFDMTIINPLNAELNPICHLLALLGAQHIFHVSRIRVKDQPKRCSSSYYVQRASDRCTHIIWYEHSTNHRYTHVM